MQKVFCLRFSLHHQVLHCLSLFSNALLVILILLSRTLRVLASGIDLFKLWKHLVRSRVLASSVAFSLLLFRSRVLATVSPLCSRYRSCLLQQVFRGPASSVLPLSAARTIVYGRVAVRKALSCPLALTAANCGRVTRVRNNASWLHSSNTTTAG